VKIEQIELGSLADNIAHEVDLRIRGILTDADHEFLFEVSKVVLWEEDKLFKHYKAILSHLEWI